MEILFDYYWQGHCLCVHIIRSLLIHCQCKKLLF